MPDPIEIEIAIAVVEHDGKFLIGRREPGVVLAGLWEFPGGKVESDETPREAAARECLEETGVEVTLGDEYPEVVHQYDHGKLRIHFFACSPKEPPADWHTRFQWVDADQLADYEFPAANKGLLELLCPARS